MRCSKLGCQNCTEGESLSAVRIVRDCNLVCLAVVCYAVYSRHFATANRVDNEFVGCVFSLARNCAVGSGKRTNLPAVLAVEVIYYLLGKGDCRA